VHFVHDGVPGEKTCRSVLRYAVALWGEGVKLRDHRAPPRQDPQTYEAAADGK